MKYFFYCLHSPFSNNSPPRSREGGHAVLGKKFILSYTAAMLVGFLIFVVIVALLTLSVQLWTGVPPYPSSKGEREQVLCLLEKNKLSDGNIYELGCGWGSLLMDLARRYPDRTVIGIELSPLPYLVSKIRSLWVPNAQVHWGNFSAVSLADAAAVTAYLMIHPMQPLAEKLDKDLRAGTPVIAVAFHFRNRRATETLPMRDYFTASVALFHWPALKP